MDKQHAEMAAIDDAEEKKPGNAFDEDAPTETENDLEPVRIVTEPDQPRSVHS